MSYGAPVVPMPENRPAPASIPVSNTVNLAEVARLKLIEKAWKYYKGDFPKSLPTNLRAVNDNVALNYVRNIVDKGAAFLFGKEPQFSNAETDTAPTATQIDSGAVGTGIEAAPEEVYLEDVWKANKKMTFLSKVGIQGGVTGHVFVKIQPGIKFPRVILLDTANVSVQTAPDDVETVSSYTIEYKVKINTIMGPVPGRHRQVIRRAAPFIEQWEIIDYEREDSATAWYPVGAEAWPYEWCPIIDCQNIPIPNEYYGIADLTADILALNEAINLGASNISRILKHHANPKTWGRGFRANDVESNVDNFLIIPTTTAEVKNLEMHSDLGASLKFLDELEEQMHETSRMPEISLGKVERLGAITGVALAVLHSPLLERTEIKQNTYGELLRRINAAFLDMGGFSADTETVIAWPKMLPTDPLGERQAAILDKNLGVSVETILSNLGYDAALEMSRTLAEALDAAHRAKIANGIIASGASPGDPAAPGDAAAATGVSDNGKIDSIKIAQYETSATIGGDGTP